MAVDADRASQIANAVSFGAKKSDFTGPMSADEEALWDAIAAEIEADGDLITDSPDLEIPDIEAVYNFYPAGYFDK